MRKLILALALLSSTNAMADDYIGNLSGNPFTPGSINNPWSKWHNGFYPDSPRNPFGPYGNPFSPYSSSNPFSTQGPRVYGGPYGGDGADTAAMQREIDELRQAQSNADFDATYNQTQQMIDADTQLLIESMQ